MKFQAKLADGQTLTVNKAFWTGKTNVSLGKTKLGTRAWNSKQAISITLNDGSVHSLVVRNDWLDPMPFLLFDDKDLLADKRLKKWQTVVVCLPAGLIILTAGGAIPALIAVGLVYLNFFIARREGMEDVPKWLIIGATPFVGLAVILSFQQAINTALNKPKADEALKRKQYRDAQWVQNGWKEDWNKRTKPATQVESEVEQGGR